MSDSSIVLDLIGSGKEGRFTLSKTDQHLNLIGRLEVKKIDDTCAKISIIGETDETFVSFDLAPENITMLIDQLIGLYHGHFHQKK